MLNMFKKEKGRNQRTRGYVQDAWTLVVTFDKVHYQNIIGSGNKKTSKNKTESFVSQHKGESSAPQSSSFILNFQPRVLFLQQEDWKGHTYVGIDTVSI